MIQVKRLDLPGLRSVEHIRRRFEQHLIQMIVQSEILGYRSSVDADARSHVQSVLQHQTEIQHLGLPAGRMRSIDPQQVRASDEILHFGNAQLRHLHPHVLGQQEQVVDQVFRLTGEFLPQDRILRSYAHRARVEVALAHHGAAQNDERCRTEAEFIGTQHGRHQDVETRPDLPIRLHPTTASIR